MSERLSDERLGRMLRELGHCSVNQMYALSAGDLGIILIELQERRAQEKADSACPDCGAHDHSDCWGT